MTILNEQERDKIDATLPRPNPVQRRVVVLASKEWPALYLISELKRAGIDLAALVFEREPADNATFSLAALRRNRSRLGLKNSLNAFFGVPLGLGYALRHLVAPRAYPTLGSVKRLGLPIEQVDAFKSDPCHDLLRRLAPDVTVICGTPILPGSLLEIARTCTLNIHTSVLPYYRGGDSLFWPLFFQDPDKVGYTIHRAVAAVAAGPYLYQKAVAVAPGDTSEKLLRRCFQDAAPQLARILREDPLEETSWKSYDLEIPIAFRRAHPVVRRYVLGPTLNHRVRASIKGLAHTTGFYPIRRRSSQPRALTFFFHRALADATPAQDWRRLLGHPTVAQIREKLVYLKRFCRLISVGEYLKLIDDRQPLKENVAVITVDDGYRDFRTKLLPLLEEQAAPATFFVCSGAIESGTVWYQEMYNLIDRVPGHRLDVPWIGRTIHFGDARHRVLTVEYGLLPYLKTLKPQDRHERIEAIYRGNGLRPELNPSDAFCSVEDLVELRGSPWVELHLHSQGHEPFATLSNAALEQDVVTCQAFFRDRLGVESGVLSYPNGSFKPRQWPILNRLGVRHAFTTLPGPVRPPTAEPMALHRKGLGAESMAEFAWQVNQALRS